MSDDWAGRLQSRRAGRAEADRRGAPQELVADEARTLRSQIRMWGKDGERHMRADDSWLGYLKGLEEDAGW